MAMSIGSNIALFNVEGDITQVIDEQDGKTYNSIELKEVVVTSYRNKILRYLGAINAGINYGINATVNVARYLPYFGPGLKAFDDFSQGNILAGVTSAGWAVFDLVTFGAAMELRGSAMAMEGAISSQGVGKVSGQGITAIRYMTETELEAVQNTGLLRGGRAGETFFTKDLYKSAASAQNRLALHTTPTLRVEFKILNNPTLLRNGSKILPANSMMGKGAEFMTLDPVKVKLINWQPLR